MKTPLSLDSGWRLASSSGLAVRGDEISSARFSPEGWYRANLPATVLATLVENGVCPDFYEGDAYLRLPGLGPPAENFSNFAMPADSPFRAAWWYRKEFELPPDVADARRWLCFDGINYRANLWVNGQLVADRTLIAGAYRGYELEVSELVKPGKNVIAVEVFAPEPDDLAITWVDWNPSPPDKNMGLWREARLLTSGPVTLRDPQVVTRLAGAERARLHVFVDLRNASDDRQRGLLELDLLGARFAKDVALEPRELRRIAITADEFPDLEIARPKLWWPRRLGAQPLHALHARFRIGDRVSDEADARFGIREVSAELTSEQHALFRVNGQRMLLRGAGFAPDLMLRSNPARDAAELAYVKDMNLDVIRFEGMLERRHFLEQCDRDGLLVIAGWCCCDHWEKWDRWKAEDHVIAAESLRSQIRRVRNHPSLIAWWYGSDFAPPPEVERRYLAVLAEENWPNPTHSSAANKPTEVTGPSGMKMNGPYDYVPPSYWLSDGDRGGAFGFATEICPGPAVPPVESLEPMLGREHLWPIDEVWKLHAGCKEFHGIDLFTRALEARYGVARSVEDYAMKAQLSTYESQRAMFEAYARNKYRATGVIQWMLNDAWPSLIWHLYDYYLRPGGGYFGTKKACEPLHVQYSYDDRSVVIVNQLAREFRGLRVDARLFDLGLRERFSAGRELDVASDSSVRVLYVPEPDEITATSFLDLRLVDREGKSQSRNFYWLSTKPDALDFSNATWVNTPQLGYADFSELGKLAPAELASSFEIDSDGMGELGRIRLKSSSATLAFFVRLRLLEGEGGREILPVLWEDNYLSLLPGEERTLVARWASGAAVPVLEVSGWNVARTIVSAGASRLQEALEA